MPYSITISLNQNYIHALVEGSNTITNVAQYLSDIQNAVVEHRCTTVLIEDHLAGSGLDTFDLFEIIRTQARYARDHKMRIAYVDLDKDHHRTTVAFAENLANILGVNVKVFSTAAEAKEWLVPAKSS